MTTATTSTQTIQLNCLTDDQLQTIFALYGAEGFNRYDDLVTNNNPPVDIQKALREFIENDTNKEQKDKLISVLDEYNLQYRAKELAFNETKEAAELALKSKRDSDAQLKSIIKGFSKQFNALVKDDNQALLQDRRINQSKQQAWNKREKIREVGKKAYLRGLVAAVIDECEVDYQAEVDKAAKTILKVSKVIISSRKIDDPLSMKGTNEVMTYSFEQLDKKPETNQAARNGSNVEDKKLIAPPIRS